MRVDQKKFMGDTMFEELVKEEITSSSRIEKSKKLEASVEVRPNGITGYLHGFVKSKDKTKEYSPLIDKENMDYYCNCTDFQMKGLVCKHILALLREINEDERGKFINMLIKIKKFEEA